MNALESKIGRTQPGTAIPTLYAGITFRSRLEADTAFLLRSVNLGWEYEKRSFLLDAGIHYTPDFFVASRHLWLEDRGYRSLEGDSQLEGFASWIHDGRPEPRILPDVAPDYIVIGPEQITLHECVEHFGTDQGAALLLRCGNCGSFSFVAQGGVESCKSNCDPTGLPFSHDDKWELGIRRGTILIDGLPMREWLDQARVRGLLPLKKNFDNPFH